MTPAPTATWMSEPKNNRLFIELTQTNYNIDLTYPAWNIYITYLWMLITGYTNRIKSIYFYAHISC